MKQSSQTASVELKEPYMQTEAQREATRKWQHIGSRIRQLCCLDSIAVRHLDADQQKVIRDIVDKELNEMGYESLTDRNKRWSEALEVANGEVDDLTKWYKFRKL